MKKYVKILSVILAAILSVSTILLSGCASGQKSAAKPSTINIGLLSDIASLDPAFAYDSNTTPVTNQLTEGLLAYDSNNKLVGKLAKSWKGVDDKTYVYEVRNDIKFSDGSPMTMDDVLFSLNRTKDPATASNEGWMYANVASTKQTGPWELTVKLSKPDSTWKYVFATTGGHIISHKYYEAHKDNFGKPNGGVLGTGPYVYKKWVTGNEIDLAKNPNYWDKSSNIQINKIVYKIIPETSTLLTAVKTGQVDVTLVPPSDTIDQFKSYKNVNTILSDGYQAEEICFNSQRIPFNDINVRRAVSSAVDAASINKKITRYDVPANALPFGKPVAAYNTDAWMKFGEMAPYYKYNMQQAKQFLAKSKYPNGFNCEILVNDGDSSRNSICLLLQQSLKELNINLSIKKLPMNDFVSYLYGNKKDAQGKRDYDLLIFAWLSDWPDPAGYMIPLYSSANIGEGGSNWSAYSNSEVDQLLNEQNETLDNGQRTKLMQQAISIANNEAAYDVINYPKDVFVINKKFSYKPSASWFYNFDVKDIKVN